MDKSGRLEIRVRPEELKILESLAHNHDTSKSDMVRMLIRDAENKKYLVLSIPEGANVESN